MLEAFQHFSATIRSGGRLQADRSALLRHGAPETPSPTATVRQRLSQEGLDGVGLSLQFDFIIVHESGTKVGNAVSAARRLRMWIHEGWTPTSSAVRRAAIRASRCAQVHNGYKGKVRNQDPIITRAAFTAPRAGKVFQGRTVPHTLRSVVNDDARWWKLLREVYQQYKYRNILTEDLVQFVNARLGRDLTPVSTVPAPCRAAHPELAFQPRRGHRRLRWNAEERRFAMPVRCRRRGESGRSSSRPPIGLPCARRFRGGVRGRDRFYYITVTRGNREEIMKIAPGVYSLGDDKGGWCGRSDRRRRGA